jgi:ATP-dependent DNA ligase
VSRSCPSHGSPQRPGLRVRRPGPLRLGAPPRFIRPCEPALVARRIDWLHEVKHDGFHVLAWKQGEDVKVWSRRGADFTDRRIAEAVAGSAQMRRSRRRGAIVFAKSL